MTSHTTRTPPHDSDTPASDALALCRHDIDRVDAVLVALLGERSRLALAVGRIKRAHAVWRAAGDSAGDAAIATVPS